MDNQQTMRSKLSVALDKTQDMEDLAPFMKRLLSVSEMKQLLVNKIDINNHNDNDLSIRKLYFDVESNYLFRCIPPQIILHKIFPFLMFKSLQEMKKLAILNKFFNELITQYLPIFAANKYKVNYFIPILGKTKKEILTLINVDHKQQLVTIVCPERPDKTKFIDNKNSNNDDSFMVVATNTYYAKVTDELDMKENKTYRIMQTSPSGWWYAYNSDDEDGWIPSNYVQRIDDNFPNYNLINKRYLREMRQAKLGINNCSFPYKNIKSWMVYDELDNIEMIDENITHNIIDVILKACSNIYSLKIIQVTTANIWMNDKLILPKCRLLCIDGMNWISIQPLIRLVTLIKNNLLYLDLHLNGKKKEQFEMDQLGKYTFLNDKNETISLRKIIDSINAASPKMHENSCLMCGQYQFQMEIVSFILNQCSNTLLVFNLIIPNEFIGNTIQHKKLYALKGCLRIPQKLEWLRLWKVSCVVDLTQNENKLIAIIMGDTSLDTPHFTDCSTKYTIPIIKDSVVYKLNKTNNKYIKDSLYSKGDSLGLLLMKNEKEFDEIEIENKIEIYKEWWSVDQCLWLKEYLEKKEKKKTMSYEEAKKLDKYVLNKESYLDDNEFQEVFGMTKEDFYKLRPWKQKNLKKAKQLF